MTAEIYRGDRLLAGKAIFLSASKPSRQKDFFRVANEDEMEEAVRCLARAVFAEGGRLVFGAHPSISPLIVDVATEYFPPRWDSSVDKRPVTIYQSKAYRDVIPSATRALQDLGYAEILWTDERDGERYDSADSDREQCLASLAHMRSRMFAETNPVAMVAAGGMQGVIREARLILEKTPGNVYTLTSSGGASEKLTQFLETNFLREESAIRSANWKRRLIPIEQRFGASDWEPIRQARLELPSQPYALLMQKVVRHIAGEEQE